MRLSFTSRRRVVSTTLGALFMSKQEINSRKKTFATKRNFRAARFAFALAYALLFLFGDALHFHAQMGCDSCPSSGSAVFRTFDGTPTVARDDFCDECRHRDDFCPACHFFSVFRFFTVATFAFLAFVCLKNRFWNDERRVVSSRRVFHRRSRAPPRAVVL